MFISKLSATVFLIVIFGCCTLSAEITSPTSPLISTSAASIGVTGNGQTPNTPITIEIKDGNEVIVGSVSVTTDGDGNYGGTVDAPTGGWPEGTATICAGTDTKAIAFVPPGQD